MYVYPQIFRDFCVTIYVLQKKKKKIFTVSLQSIIQSLGFFFSPEPKLIFKAVGNTSSKCLPFHYLTLSLFHTTITLE